VNAAMSMTVPITKCITPGMVSTTKCASNTATTKLKANTSGIPSLVIASETDSIVFPSHPIIPRNEVRSVGASISMCVDGLLRDAATAAAATS